MWGWVNATGTPFVQIPLKPWYLQDSIGIDPFSMYIHWIPILTIVLDSAYPFYHNIAIEDGPFIVGLR